MVAVIRQVVVAAEYLAEYRIVRLLSYAATSTGVEHGEIPLYDAYEPITDAHFIHYTTDTQVQQTSAATTIIIIIINNIIPREFKNFHKRKNVGKIFIPCCP